MPFGYFRECSHKVGDFYALDDFILLDMAIDAYAQIILGRPFLATSGYKVDVKEGRLTFDVGECHLGFVFFENQNIP